MSDSLTVARSFVANSLAPYTQHVFGRLQKCLAAFDECNHSESLLVLALGPHEDLFPLQYLLREEQRPFLGVRSGPSSEETKLHMFIWATSADSNAAILLYRMLSGLRTVSVWIVIRDDYAVHLTQADRCRLGGAL